jgi:hypothetical protein
MTKRLYKNNPEKRAPAFHTERVGTSGKSKKKDQPPSP